MGKFKIIVKYIGLQGWRHVSLLNKEFNRLSSIDKKLSIIKGRYLDYYPYKDIRELYEAPKMFNDMKIPTVPRITEHSLQIRQQILENQLVDQWFKVRGIEAWFYKERIEYFLPHDFKFGRNRIYSNYKDLINPTTLKT